MTILLIGYITNIIILFTILGYAYKYRAKIKGLKKRIIVWLLLTSIPFGFILSFIVYLICFICKNTEGI